MEKLKHALFLAQGVFKVLALPMDTAAQLENVHAQGDADREGSQEDPSAGFGER